MDAAVCEIQGVRRAVVDGCAQGGKEGRPQAGMTRTEYNHPPQPA
jgi:hypothetical protein